MKKNGLNIIISKNKPENLCERSETEKRVYEMLEKLNITYTRADHKKADTMDVCEEISKVLDTKICKNLFLCNRNKSEFYLLMMPADKPFETKTVSKLAGSSRLSFADNIYMEEFLDTKSGSLSVLGLMNDKENRVRLLIDKSVIENDTIGCHPCVSTSSLKIATTDILNIFLPFTSHQPKIIDIP